MNAGAVDVPVMERRAEGEEVPNPRLPFWLRMRSVEVALLGPVVEATANNGDVDGKMLGAATESIAHGEEEPMPMALFVVSSVRKFAESRVLAPE